MKRLFNILVFCCLCLPLFAQEEEMFVIDSMRNVMARQEGREKVETMIELSKAFFDFSFDDCIDWGEKAIEEAFRLQDEELIAKSYWKIGLRYLNHYDLDLAHEQFNKAFKILKNKGDTELLMDVLNYKGRVELFMGEMDSALITYHQALQVSENLDDELNCADVTNNMAYIYSQKDEDDLAFEYFLKARSTFVRVDDTLSVAQCDHNIANTYASWHQYNEALSVYYRIIPVFEDYNDLYSLSRVYNNIGLVYSVGMVNVDSSMFYFEKSIEIAEVTGDVIIMIDSEIGLANVQLLKGKNDEAIELYESALSSSKEIGYSNGIISSYAYLGKYYCEIGNFSMSSDYLSLCRELEIKQGVKVFDIIISHYLIKDYARLGRYIEMDEEMKSLLDAYDNLLNRNNELSKELSRLKYNDQLLMVLYDSQNDQIQTLQAQRNHYRLAFFGLLSIILVAVAFWIFRRILLNNRHRSK